MSFPVPDKNEAQAIAALTRNSDWPAFAAYLDRVHADYIIKMGAASDLVTMGRCQGAHLIFSAFPELQKSADSILKSAT